MAIDRQGRLVATVGALSTTRDTVTAIVRLLPSGSRTRRSEREGSPGSNGDFAVARLYSSHLFQDGLELGTAVRWSRSVGSL
jgi:hypothetical protein